MHKALMKYQRSQSFSRSSTDLVSQLFYKCAHYVDQMAQNLKEKAYYARFQNSERVIMLLTHFLSLLENEGSEAKNFNKDLQEFCAVIFMAITEIHQKENQDLCLTTSKLLREMGDIWKGGS